MKTPTVSVIMPAYNHERYVGEAIESVLNQTFADFEFIIINDGSTDDTDNVIRKYNDSGIQYHVQKNMDAPNTINRGISLAKGKYISIINSDDLYHPERLSSLVETAETQNAKFIFTDLEFIDEGSNVIEDQSHSYVSWFNRMKSMYSDAESLEMVFFVGNMAVSTSNFFFHSMMIEKIGLFSPYRYVHDYDFILRALAGYCDEFVFLADKKYLFYRLHGKNTIKESPIKARMETTDLLIKMIPEFIHSGKDGATIEAALKQIQTINSDLLQKVSSMENTISWKITAPLRQFGRLLMKLKILK